MGKKSGHPFHFEIEDRIKADGWSITSEPAYVDDVEKKPRWVDFTAEIETISSNPRGNKLAIVGECKYLKKDITCWMRPNPKNKSVYFVDGYMTQELMQYSSDKFHYFSPDLVATQVGDELYEAVMQASKALMFFRQSGQHLHSKGVFYPMVVYGGKGKLVDQNKMQLTSFIYYHQYPWQDKQTGNVTTRSIYVDVVHEKELEIFLQNIFRTEAQIVMRQEFIQQRIQENIMNARRKDRRNETY